MTKHDNVSQEGIMKATEFVKEHGIEKARECIEYANDYGGFWVNAKTLELSNLIPSYDAVSIPSIQRLVESHEIVHNFGGIKRAKRILKKAYTTFNTRVSVVWNDKPFQCSLRQLEQAVCDVEACQ